MRSVRDTLAAHNIQVHEQWMEVMGAVVGKDEEAVKTGIKAVLGSEHHAAFFRRTLCDVLPVHSAMLLLRQCAVPQLNYLLRCLAPPCIAAVAHKFDTVMLECAKDKLDLTADERTPEQDRILRLKLSDGGFGLTSALQTSPAAYLGSLAAVRKATVFTPFACEDNPLPSDSLLHGWIGSSMQLITNATPTSADSLPPSASSFFYHYTSPNVDPKVSSSLQRTLSSQANSYAHQATLTAARKMKKKDEGKALAHALAISAPKASQWKNTLPSTPHMTLTDTQYRIAARLNLGLSPLSGMNTMSAECIHCGKKEAMKQDPWHSLSCPKAMGDGGTISIRHNAVVDAL